MDAAVRGASDYFAFKRAVLEAENAFNRATLTEFKGRLITDEIDGALDSYVRAQGHLDRAIDGTDEMLALVRANGCLAEFDAALASRLEEAGANDHKRVSEQTIPISTIEDVLLVQKAEFQALSSHLTDAIRATGDFEDEIAAGTFVATLLGEPNELKTAKGELEYGIRTVTDLLAVTTHSTAVALEDIFPLGSELLLDEKESDGSTPILPIAVAVLAGLVLVVGVFAWRRRSRRERRTPARTGS